MGKQRKKRKNQTALFALLLLLLAGTLLLRAVGAEEAPSVVIETPPPVTPAAAATQPIEEQPAASGPIPAAQTPAPTAIAAPPTPPPAAPKGYDAQSYQLVSDIIYIYRYQQEERAQLVPGLLEKLKAADPALGETWDGIVKYWEYANTEMEPHYAPPAGLPEDDSLCFVVLGFQLGNAGEMAPELLARCEIALECAQTYPNAYIAVTGGGTAPGNKNATEAGVMAAWLIDKGIDPERIIVEDASLTTDQNARFTSEILTERYPQVHALVIITSDYHLPLGCLLFAEAALLYGYEHGSVPFSVVSNASCAVKSYLGNWDMRNQASYVWLLADPRY